MANVWRMRAIGREAWYFKQPHKDVVYLHLFFNDGLSLNNLYGNGVLAEH